MGDHPSAALRAKRRASVVVATELVRDGHADAVVSAGSTGATMAAAVFRLGRIEGIERPALGAHLVTPEGPIMILDVGANVDCDADNLLQFAVMGSIYAEHVLHVPQPRVGLLNIGEEAEKGNRLSQEANRRLRQASLNFVGNVEGNDLIAHHADVVVCDGFIGNVILKFFEGLTTYIFRSVREDLQQGPIAPLALLALRARVRAHPSSLRLRTVRWHAAPRSSWREHRHPRTGEGADGPLRHGGGLRRRRGPHPRADRPVDETHPAGLRGRLAARLGRAERD